MTAEHPAPWWAQIPCDCRQRPRNDPDWWGRFYWCETCGQRWRLMPNGNGYGWARQPKPGSDRPYGDRL